MSPSYPPAAYADDAVVSELQVSEQLLVATLRLYALECRDPGGTHPDWRGGFQAAGIDGCGAPALDRLLRILAAGAQHPLDVRCAWCRLLGKDEARLLQLVGLLQRGRLMEASAILSAWLPPAAARMALLPAEGLAAALVRGGLVVPWRHAEAARLERNAQRFADRGLALVQ